MDPRITDLAIHPTRTTNCFVWKKHGFVYPVTGKIQVLPRSPWPKSSHLWKLNNCVCVKTTHTQNQRSKKSTQKLQTLNIVPYCPILSQNFPIHLALHSHDTTFTWRNNRTPRLRDSLFFLLGRKENFFPPFPLCSKSAFPPCIFQSVFSSLFPPLSFPPCVFQDPKCTDLLRYGLFSMPSFRRKWCSRRAQLNQSIWCVYAHPMVRFHSYWLFFYKQRRIRIRGQTQRTEVFANTCFLGLSAPRSCHSLFWFNVACDWRLRRYPVSSHNLSHGVAWQL